VFWLHTALGNKEPLELVGWDEQNGELQGPEEQVADHPLCGDADALRDVVGDVEVGGPDGTDDLSHGRRPSVCLDGVPEQGGDGTSDNGESREVPAERSTSGNGEGDVEPGANDTVEDERDSAGQTTEDDAYDCLAPR
jgi:hypothetical protein